MVSGAQRPSRLDAAERRQLNRSRWLSLPQRLRTPQQVSGRAYVACGATHGIMETCNYSCTSCYLTDIANRTPALPFEEVCGQLDLLRQRLGPSAKIQLTSGEVTLLPVETLGEMVGYAKRIGLDPMVMTNGQRFVDQPGYLETLVQDYGLQKVSIHIDTTQRGRKPAVAATTETQLHPVRDHYAGMIREARRKTGCTLHAAQTVTVTPSNLGGVADVVRWVVRNADAFRMLSFQPIAAVGRTRDARSQELDLDRVWHEVCQGIGHPLNRDALHFGHPACNVVCPLLVVSTGEHHEVVESARRGKRWDRWIMQRAIRSVGAARDVRLGVLRQLLRHLQALAREPGLVLAALPYLAYRLWGQRRTLLRMLGAWARLRPVAVRPLAIIVHRFMDTEELATPLGRERLAACVFRVPVEGRLVSMCELNATSLRRQLNEAARRRSVSVAGEVSAPG